jgi:hypothetical protein
VDKQTGMEDTVAIRPTPSVREQEKFLLESLENLSTGPKDLMA